MNLSVKQLNYILVSELSVTEKLKTKNVTLNVCKIFYFYFLAIVNRLNPQCRAAVGNFTEEEAQHVELNPIIMSVCQGVMQRHCENELKMGNDEGDILERSGKFLSGFS